MILCSYVPIPRGDEPNYIPELNRTDAIISLLFLDPTDMVYREKVEDPWFAATTNAPEWLQEVVKELGLGFESLHVPDEPATVIGCTSQVFYCNTKTGLCANLYKSESQLESVAPIWPESNDFKAFIGYLSTNNVMLATPGSFYDYQGLPNMLARFTLEGPMQWDAVPRDQWKREMEFISQASLASFWSNVPQASQNGVCYLNRTLCEDETEPGLCEKLCKSQKVRSSEYYSFNVQKSEHGALSYDSDPRSLLPSRNSQRPGYARIFTEEADTLTCPRCDTPASGYPYCSYGLASREQGEKGTAFGDVCLGVLV
ncbi:hypothetical protein P171DRAFT_443143 [Karstenula rhodostoma CBS 690.94]|uniref:Uncharacterized protein n=1 Tax=Karstenula rhodostoma CBS 690.94 TaxID=1392251 RepID=A0A9P4PK58_9PLEO|nr:hypothetical protein P171DRAFT_443143 [Karstenula rhodostoma CBS 690.94]